MRFPASSTPARSSSGRCQAPASVYPPWVLHRAIGRRTPHDAYTSRLKATTRYRTRHDTIDTNGRVSLRYRGRLHHIGIGRRRAGTAITMLIAERDIRIIDTDTGELIRALTLDTSRDYQPQNAKD